MLCIDKNQIKLSLEEKKAEIRAERSGRVWRSLPQEIRHCWNALAIVKI